MVYCVGLTGLLASGKSTVAQFFSEFGVPVLSADVVSKELVTQGNPAYAAIVAHFGSSIIDENQDLDRKKLRHIIFTNRQERRWLEGLLHPLIRQELIALVALSPPPYCIVEIPLLVNIENYSYINRVLLVSASLHLQITRVMQRDKCTEEQARAIIASQPSFEERKKFANDIIENNSNLQELKTTVSKLHKKYLVQATMHSN